MSAAPLQRGVSPLREEGVSAWSLAPHSCLSAWVLGCLPPPEQERECGESCLGRGPSLLRVKEQDGKATHSLGVGPRGLFPRPLGGNAGQNGWESPVPFTATKNAVEGEQEGVSFD